MNRKMQPPTPTEGNSGLSRRSLLALGGAGAVIATLEWSSPALAGQPTPTGTPPHGLVSRVPVARVRKFDDDWLFHRGALTGADSPGYADGTWRKVTTPHDWSIEDLPNQTATDGGATADPAAWLIPASAPVRIGPFDSTATASGGSQAWTVGGEGWYRKHFSARGIKAGDRAEIRFDGIYENSDVWINGHHLGFQAYGYIPITYDLTPYLSLTGDNVISVRVRNIGETSRWYSGSGILRNVTFAVTHSLYVPQYGVRVTTHDVTSRQASVSVTGLAQNGGTTTVDTRARISLLDSQGHAVARQTTVAQAIAAGASAAFRLDFVLAQPHLWSPQSPSRYTAKVELINQAQVLDAETAVFGVRDISITGRNGLRVNGRTMKLRGANLHTDLGALGGAAIPEAEMRRLRIVKAAGFNAIRTSHNPQSAAFLNACDELGFLVIAELYDVWSEHKRADDYAPFFDSTWRHDVKRVIDRDANHPSIIMWSTMNELAIRSRSPLQDVYGKPLADYCRQLDPTRPVTQGSAMGHALGLRLPDDSPEWSYLDVASVHYLKQTDDGFEHIHDAHPDMPLYIGETWGSELYDFTKTVSDNRWVIGEFAWTGMDYLGEAGIGIPQSLPAGTHSGGTFGSGYPVFNSYCGDIDLIGQPKPQLAWRRVVWGQSALEIGVERPTPAGFEQSIALWSYYDELPSWTWNVQAQQAMRVRVYTSGDRVVLRLNNVVVGEASLTEADKMVATFAVPYTPGTLTATAYTGRRAIATKKLTTVGAAARLRLAVEERRLGGHTGSLAHVLVSVVDSAGNDVPDAVVKVSFGLTGPATLAAVSSANPHNVDSFRQPHRYTYHGKALAIIRSTRGNGMVKLTASAPKLGSASVHL